MEKYANIVLRVGLGLFLLIWGFAKFVQPEFWSKYVPNFYGMAVGTGLMSTLGAIEIIVAIALIIGWKTRLAAAIGGIIHLSTTVVTLKQIFNPYALVEGMPPNIIFFGAVPILAAFIALYFRGPGEFSVDKKKK